MNTQAKVSPAACPVRCILKLGGSAITNKHQLETLRQDVLQQVCQSIKQYHSTCPGGMVLVHGAGSFGHFQASQYGVARGGTDAVAAVQGFVETRRSVTQLNHTVVSALIDAGVPAVGLSPCGSWQCSNRQLQDAAAGVAAVLAVLQHGMVPVLHGDCVFDSQLGVTILSGDTIIRGLAEALQPQYCVFLTDVAGLFTRPPDQPGAKLIPAIDVAADGSWSAAAAAPGSNAPEGSLQKQGGAAAAAAAVAAHGGCSHIQLSAAAHDTTGGIAAKIAEAAAVALTGCPVVIAQAGTPSGAAAVSQGPQAFAGSNSSSRSNNNSSSATQGQHPGLQATVVRLANKP